MAVTYFQIGSTVNVGTAQAAIEFTSIPSTYTDLLIKLTARASITSSSNTWEDIGIAFNGAALNNSVTSKVLYGFSTTTGSGSNVGWSAGFAASSTATASTFSNVEIYIPNYTSSVAKSFSVDASSETNGTSGINGLVAGLWNPSTQAAITGIKLGIVTGSSPLFVQYSSASLYGIKKD